MTVPVLARTPVATAEDMRDLATGLAALLRAGDVVVLDGALGAGKTTFTQGLARGLGITDPVTSPTFVIARAHVGPVGGAGLVHVDAYRLGSALELDDLDLDVDTAVVGVEWGAGLAQRLVDSVLLVRIDRSDGAADSVDPVDDVRWVSATGIGPRWAKYAPVQGLS